jgi:hypothetical protein
MLWIDLAFATLVFVTLVNVLACLVLAMASQAHGGSLDPGNAKESSQPSAGLR